MKKFGIVSEGVTDQEVISNILYGFYNNPDIIINELQPLRDETDNKKSSNLGGWGNLLEYCKSDVFKYAFQTNNYIIIQIDTDVCEEYGISKKKETIDKEVDELIFDVSNKLIATIGSDFYKKYQNRIIFAIAVHSIECWLLPIYYSDAKKNKTINCLQTLNQALSKKGFTIDAKKLEYYEEITKVFLKRKNLEKYYPHNPSFNFFIERLKSLDVLI